LFFWFGSSSDEQRGFGKHAVRECLLGLLLQEGDEVVSVLALLETGKCHLGTWDVLLGVLEVGKLRYRKFQLSIEQRC
jgi:hypothetical protein